MRLIGTIAWAALELYKTFVCLYCSITTNEKISVIVFYIHHKQNREIGHLPWTPFRLLADTSVFTDRD